MCGSARGGRPEVTATNAERPDTRASEAIRDSGDQESCVGDDAESVYSAYTMGSRPHTSRSTSTIKSSAYMRRRAVATQHRRRTPHAPTLEPIASPRLGDASAPAAEQQQQARSRVRAAENVTAAATSNVCMHARFQPETMRTTRSDMPVEKLEPIHPLPSHLRLSELEHAQLLLRERLLARMRREDDQLRTVSRLVANPSRGITLEAFRELLRNKLGVATLPPAVEQQLFESFSKSGGLGRRPMMRLLARAANIASVARADGSACVADMLRVVMAPAVTGTPWHAKSADAHVRWNVSAHAPSVRYTHHGCASGGAAAAHTPLPAGGL